MFGKKTQPTNELDQRAAEHAQQLQELDANTAEDRREDAADKMADAEIDNARNASGQLINDPDARAGAAPDDIERSLTRLRKAKNLKIKTSTTLAAGRLRRGDLLAQGQALGALGHGLAKDQSKLDHERVLARKLRPLLEFAAIEMEEHRILAEAPAGAGLIPCTFPKGIFRPVETALGPDCPKSVFLDDVLRAVGVAYPSVLKEVLPPDESAAILAAIERDCAKGVVRFAGQAISWVPAGAWHQGRITADELKSYLSGRLRREHHDL